MLSTAGERFALAGARLETSSVTVRRAAAQDWAPRHGSHATPGKRHSVDACASPSPLGVCGRRLLLSKTIRVPVSSAGALG